MTEQRGQGEMGEPRSVDASQTQDKLPKVVDPLIGQVIDGRYRIESRLGEGGMGVVYRASHATLGKTLAMKVLRPEVSRNEEIVARFKQEAQSASAIGNQHIIDIIDFGSLADGSTYFVMEFLSGQSLTDALAKGRFSEQRAIHIAKQLCRALGAAHESGIVHRDMKPDNVQLVTRGGDEDFVKVLDFGIAKVGGSTSKLTQAGQVFGTPHYMSPEQCAGTNVDQRTDVYAVGVILYEMGTGKVPFDADNLMGILTKHLYEKPVAPHTLPPPHNVTPAMESVILKCLQKKVETRYQTMAELLADLEAVEQGQTPEAVVDQIERNSYNQTMAGGLEEGVGRITLGVGDAQIPTRSKLPLLLGLTAAVLVAAATYFALSGSDPAASDTQPPPTAQGEKPAPPVEEGPAAEAPSEAEPVVAEPEAPAVPQLTLSSTPAGAEVYRDDVLLGTTPFVAFKPAGTETVLLTLKKSGYEDKSVMVRALSPDSLAVALNKTKVVRKPSTKPASSGKSNSGSGSKGTAPKAPTPAKPAAKPTSPGRLQSEVLDPWE